MRILCLLVLFSLKLWGQAEFELEASLKLPGVDYVTADQFGNIYTISGNEFKKYDRQGLELCAFSKPILGELAIADVFNPIRPLLFYRDANQVVITDNRLNEKQLLNLSEFGFYDVQLLALADQENIWLYNQSTDLLYRLNINSATASNRSLNITQLLAKENTPSQLISTVDHLYLNVPGAGIMVFDALGSFKNLLPLKNLDSFDVAGNRLYGLRAGRVLIYNLNDGQLEPVLMEDRNWRQLQFAGDKLYLYDGSLLQIFSPAD